MELLSANINNQSGHSLIDWIVAVIIVFYIVYALNLFTTMRSHLSKLDMIRAKFDIDNSCFNCIKDCRNKKIYFLHLYFAHNAYDELLTLQKRLNIAMNINGITSISGLVSFLPLFFNSTTGPVDLNFDIPLPDLNSHIALDLIFYIIIFISVLNVGIAHFYLKRRLEHYEKYQSILNRL